jgi:hypothetical protein
VKILEILEAYIKFWNKIISFDMRKKGEFGSPWSGFLGFKRDTPNKRDIDGALQIH